MKIILRLHLYFTEEDDLFLARSPELNIMAFGTTVIEAETEFYRLAERVMRYYKWNGKLEQHLARLGWRESDGNFTYLNRIIPPREKIVSNKEVMCTFTLPTKAHEPKVLPVNEHTETR
jgi:hypothetical protein